MYKRSEETEVIATTTITLEGISVLVSLIEKTKNKQERIIVATAKIVK